MDNKNNINVSVKKYSFSEVIEEGPEYTIQQIKKEVPKKAVSNGSQVRITTLINLCDLLSKLNRKVDLVLQNQTTGVRK